MPGNNVAVLRTALLSALVLAGSSAGAQPPTLEIPHVARVVTMDGTFAAGEWTGALTVAVEGTTPTTNPGWNPLNGRAVAAADLSYTLHLMHDGESLFVAFDVTDDSVSDDYVASRTGHTEVWNDDCTEVFIDGDRDRDVTESSGGSPAGDRDWREGQQPHASVKNGAYWEANSGQYGRTWWAATARTAQGYRTEYRFALRGIDTADGGAAYEPAKIGDTIGFSVLVNDDDNGGDREDQLAWWGGGTDDSLFRSQQNWGFAKLMPPVNFVPPGIPTRAENTSLPIDSVPDDNPGAMVARRAFPQLSFERPVLLIESPDTSGRLFVVEQRGRIRTFPKSADPTPASVTTFLDIAARVRSPLEGGGELEEGLLGLAFDPDFATNGEFYTFSSPRTNPRRHRLSRFTVSPPNASSASAATEEVILEIPDPAANHNGGMIAFGPDGMLYAGIGDGGGAGDDSGAGNNSQNTTLLLGKMIRIDVRSTPDPGLAYRIPPDNPFYNGGPAGTSTRREIWAYGLRNPWRWSFDAQTGALLAADVGQANWEEINVIRPGRNYGWRVMEGPDCYNPNPCNRDGLTLPIAQYSHDFGLSVTGGFVYYGSAVPALYGRYLYGDYVSGRIWSLTWNPDTDTATAPVEVADLTGIELGAFGQDKAGEVYLLNLTNGQILELRPGSGNSGAAVRTEPAPPVRGQSVTITYNAAGRPLAGQGAVNLYWGYNGWTNVSTLAMTAQGNDIHTRTFTVPVAATVLDFVFNSGGTTWDNNDGADWHVTTTAGSGSSGPVTLTPSTPVRGQQLTVVYDATGRPLAGQANVNIYHGINGWSAISTNAMTSLGSNRFSYTWTVPASATVLDMVFNNGGSIWDNNGSADWHFPTAAAKAASLTQKIAAACEGTEPFPTRLSDIPALLAAGAGIDQTNLGIIPYEPSAKLWSDGTRKERFIALPGLDTIGYRDIQGWDFPEDTVIIKNFVLPLDERNPDATLRRIETRLLVKNCDQWYGFSYEWNDAQTDAVLLTTGKKKPFTITDRQGNSLAYQWQYPSRDQCSICHTTAANSVLGLNTAQMNHEFLYPRSGVRDNQLRAMQYISLFGKPGLPAEPQALPSMPDAADTRASLRDRARAYLAANCSHCHQPGGGGGALMDLRWHIADADTGILDTPPANTLGIPNARLVAPGDPMRSVLYRRMHTTDGAIRMPPLATSRIDEEGTAVVRQWIESLGTAPQPAEQWTVY